MGTALIHGFLHVASWVPARSLPFHHHHHHNNHNNRLRDNRISSTPAARTPAPPIRPPHYGSAQQVQAIEQGDFQAEREKAQDQKDTGGAWVGAFRRRGGCYSHPTACKPRPPAGGGEEEIKEECQRHSGVYIGVLKGSRPEEQKFPRDRCTRNMVDQDDRSCFR